MCSSTIRLACSSLLTFAVACAPPTPSLEPSPQSSSETLVTIDNEHTSDADVYAVRLGSRIRIGFVQSHSTATIRVPLTALEAGDLQLVLHLIGLNTDYRSPTLHVEPGQTALLEIQPELYLSSFTIRR